MYESPCITADITQENDVRVFYSSHSHNCYSECEKFTSNYVCMNEINNTKQLFELNEKNVKF